MNRFFKLLAVLAIGLVALGTMPDVCDAASLTDAQVRTATRNAHDPSNAPPALLQSTNLTVAGQATVGALTATTGTITTGTIGSLTAPNISATTNSAAIFLIGGTNYTFGIVAVTNAAGAEVLVPLLTP